MRKVTLNCNIERTDFLNGVGRRKGEGFSGTCIKGTWTKPKGGGRIKCGKRGWLGLGGGKAENGDNCTWTTIKNIY